MLVAVDLPVLLEHAVLGSSTHEVEITLAGGQTAAHSGSRLPTTITTLQNERLKTVTLINFDLYYNPYLTCAKLTF